MTALDTTISIVQLAEHRFGSHVLETLLEVGAETIDRETRGIFPAAQSLPQFAEQPTLSDIISQMSQVRSLVSYLLVLTYHRKYFHSQHPSSISRSLPTSYNVF